ncbi:unnamed protein product [Paramecium pentaurelia]|uniref:WD domain, G-beta repeat protein n=1 Tax=Paramecium pentaurelia TaxID=43138 RepID=A0A8S1WHK2_9CILI|nr:unnamed protein product [Paramecium pentaurelia]
MKCSISNHSEFISFACLDEFCTQFRLGCVQCITNNIHFEHINNLKQTPDLLSFLSEKSKQCNKFINQLNILNEKINEIFDYLNQMMGIDFSITGETLKQINSQSMNNIIAQLIKFNSECQPFIQLASQNTEILIKCFSQFFQSQEILQDPLEQNDQITTNNTNSEIQLFKYQVINSIKENDYCFSVCFNQDSSIMITGYMDGIIKIFQFNQGNIKILQRLNEHKGIVECLNYMNQSNSLLSGSLDNSVIILKIYENNKWYAQQKLTEHNNWIRCILINQFDDLIISGSRDKSIKFWRKDNLWQCSQTLNHHNSDMMSTSLNESQNYLISCAQDDNEILISQQQENKEWIIIQKINQQGQRLCFISDSLFIVQPYLSSKMNIYELNHQTKLFNQINELQIKNGICKNGFNINLIKINQQAEFKLIQFIDLGTGNAFGRLTADGQFMVIWDDKTQQIQIFLFKEIKK